MTNPIEITTEQRVIEVTPPEVRIVELVREGPQGPVGPQGPQGEAGSAGDHEHDIDQVDGLQAALDAKANTSHTHAQSDVTGLAAALAAKLDSSSYTASDVLAKLVTVDGVGSGLDADTLDGLSSGAFALSGHNHAGVYQPIDATLSALAGVTVSADKVIYATGADAFATTDLPAFGRTLIANANAADARSDLGLGTAATSASGDFAAASHGHSASEITSGLLATARIASGTASDGYVPVSDGAGNIVWEAQSGSGGGSTAWGDITGKPTTLGGYGITDAASDTELTTGLATKLDASSYTAADVLTKLLTVDGSGSGLDADTLDGLSSAAFATAGHNHSGVYAPVSHTHVVADITDFDPDDYATLASPAFTGTPTSNGNFFSYDGHGHGMADITGLVLALSEKQDVGESYVAGETLASRDFVEVYDDAGTNKMRKANASSGRDPDGFVTAAVTSGNTGTMVRRGLLSGFAGLTSGSNYVLSASVAGAATLTAPTTSGHRIWHLGKAISTTEIYVDIRFVGEIA